MHGEIPFKANPFTFWTNLAIFGNLFEVNFSEKFRSNEAQPKLKTLFYSLKKLF